MKKVLNVFALLFVLLTFHIVFAVDETVRTDVIVTITGKQNTAVFDGMRHGVNGYDVSISNDLYTEEDFEFEGSAVAVRNTVGISYMGLKPEQFLNKNTKFNVIFDVTDGYQEITSLDEVVVKITGHNNTAVFDGNEHMVTGYDVEINTSAYEESDFTFYGRADAKRTNVGRSCMGLREDNFRDLSGKFEKVTFVITDGCQEIIPSAVTPINLFFYNIQDDGKEGIPADVESGNIPLMAVIKNDVNEFISEVLNIDTHFLMWEPRMPFTLTYRDVIPDLTGGQYSVEIYGLPEMIHGTEFIEGSDNAEKNQYSTSSEVWIDEDGNIELTVLWTAKKYYEIIDEPGVEILPEDTVGSYVITDDGEKEYVVFNSYDICMNYLGNDELCNNSGRTYKK